MNQRVRGLRSFGVVALLTCLVPLAGFGLSEAGAQEVQLTASEKLAQRIDFQAKAYSNDPFDPTYAVSADPQKPIRVRPGQTFRLIITGTPKGNYYTYAMFPGPGMGEGKRPNLRYKVPSNAPLQPLTPVTESTSKSKSVMGETVYVHTKPFTWSQDVLVPPDASPGTHTLDIPIRLMACDDKDCVGPNDYPPLKVSVEVAGEKVAVSPELEKRFKASNPWPRLSPIGTGDPLIDNPPPIGQGDLGSLLLGAFLGAFLMLLTPCVFPMIPITVNFFLKQSEKQHNSPLVMACVYSGTIIVLLTLVMLLLGNVVISLANNAWFNLVMGGVLVVFALSLFGMYELQLPSGLARFTSAHEGQGGYFGALFMALTFTITSFTCTGPFLGAMLGGIASVRPPLHHLILGSLVYSTTFAAPFFVLALFPSMLKKLPKSGGWMNAVKVTMAFVELAAAMKFLSIADVVLNPGNPRLFNYDTVLCAWIALSVGCGLYLLGAYRLPHDDAGEHIGVPRVMFAVLFIGLAVYMTPALFGSKPQGVVGENLVAFLPPKFSAVKEWHLDYEDAWAEARAQKKLLFIDFTGVNCQNCRDNEINVFPDPRVKELLKNYVVVQLYTDSVPIKGLDPAKAEEMAERNARWRNAIGNVTNPYYFIFEPGDTPFTADDQLNGRALGSRNGKIFNIEDFVKFLKRRPGPAVVAQAK